MKLKPGQAIEWHTTGPREEVLVILGGAIRLELMPRPARHRSLTLRAGRCAFLPRGLRHRVLNRSRRLAHYLYFTA